MYNLRIYKRFIFLFSFICLLFNLIVIYTYRKTASLGDKKPASSLKYPTIFCMILSSPKNFVNLRAQTTLNVWGYKCDNFKLVTLAPKELNRTNYNLLESFIMRPNNLREENYSKLTNKVFLAFQHIYKDFGNYDWYLKADDDTFIEVDNLKKFLLDKNPREPVTYGYEFSIPYGKYLSGGAGYLLSREALKRLAQVLNRNPELCLKTGVEDFDVSRCLNKLNVTSKKSLDKLGKERFYPINLSAIYLKKIPKWMKTHAVNPIKLVTLFINFL